MLKIGFALAIVLGAGFLLIPQLRPAIIGLAPFALFALCPLSMIFMMSSMDKSRDHHDNATADTSERKHPTL